MQNAAIAVPCFTGEPHDLSRDDLARLAEGKRTVISTPMKLRNSHHMIARLAAAGLSNIDIGTRVGYTRERVGQLLASPAMEELIARYRDKIDEKFLNNVDTYMELATANMVAAERHIADRIDALDEEGELMPLREAVLVSRDAADRFGYGKRQTNVNVNADFASMLEKSIARSGKTIDGTATPPARPTMVRALEQARLPEARAKTPIPEPLLLIRRRA